MKKIISYLLLVFVSACIVSILLIFWILFIKLRNCWELTFNQKLSLLLDENTSFNILNQYCTEKNKINDSRNEFYNLYKIAKQYSWCTLLNDYQNIDVFDDKFFEKLNVNKNKEPSLYYQEASNKIKEFCISEQISIEQERLWLISNIAIEDNIETLWICLFYYVILMVTHWDSLKWIEYHIQKFQETLLIKMIS